MLDAPTVEERLGKDLSHGYCGAPVHALGCVGIEEPFSDAIYRLKHSNDPKAYNAALRAVSGLSRTLDARHNWRYRAHDDLAVAVLEYWLCDLCPACTGIGARAILGTPMLDDGCPSCGGSGKRPYPWFGREGRYHTETLWALQAAELRIRNKLIDRLAHQIRDAGLL